MTRIPAGAIELYSTSDSKMTYFIHLFLLIHQASYLPKRVHCMGAFVELIWSI